MYNKQIKEQIQELIMVINFRIEIKYFNIKVVNMVQECIDNLHLIYIQILCKIKHFKIILIFQHLYQD